MNPGKKNISGFKQMDGLGDGALVTLKQNKNNNG